MKHVEDAASKKTDAGRTTGMWVAAAFIVFAAAFAVFIPALSGEFLAWDDLALTVENHDLRRDFGIELFKWAYTTAFLKVWTPLTLVSFALDFKLWGFDPWWFHFHNNLLHALNSLLVLLVSYRLVLLGCGSNDARARMRALAASFVAALVFAVHPLHVESVAWIAERKDVLFAFFYLLGLLSYLRYASRQSCKWLFYALTVVFAFASVSSKPMAVTFPAVLAILDVFPLRRVKFEAAEWRAALWACVDKIPFAATSLFATIVMFEVNRGGGVFKHVERVSALMTAKTAVAGYIFYLYKFVLPLDLLPLYHNLVRSSMFPLKGAGSAAVLAVITAYAVISIRKRPYIAAAWAFYCFTLLPTVPMHHAANRYAYISLAAPALLLGLLAASFVERQGGYKAAACVIVAAMLAVLSVLSVRHSRIWHDDLALWSYHGSKTGIDVATSKHTLALVNRGSAYAKKGLLKEALADFNKAIRNNPSDEKALYGRGAVYLRTGDAAAAMDDFTKTVELNPKYGDAYVQRGLLRLKIPGAPDIAGALDDFNAATEIAPREPMNYFYRASALALAGRLDAAIEDFGRAIELDPSHARTYFNRGDARAALGDFSGAEADFSAALRLDPESVSALTARGDVNAALGRHVEAARDYEAALERSPGDAETKRRLEQIRRKPGR